MSLSKNQIIPLTIEGLTSEGSGVGHYEGQAVFVPGAAPGDTARIRIVKPLKHYAFGIIEEITSPAPCRIEADCAVCKPCGGCCYRHITYQAELAAKQQVVADAFARLGGLPEVPVLDILASPMENEYRNKVQYPIGRDAQGHIVCGFYARHSHRIVPCPDCRLQPDLLNRIAQTTCRVLEKLNISVYDETAHKGLARHIFLRRGHHSGEVMLCLVINGKALPKAQTFCKEMLEAHPEITTILCNINTAKTNVITGLENVVYYGSGTIRDTMCGVPVTLGPLSFYQVNTPSAEKLYRTARELAQLQPGDVLLDLYCGMGTIGLSMAEGVRRLVGVEIIPEAVESAKKNAANMGIENARFLCADAGKAAAQLAKEGLLPDVIVLDPPRKGCDRPTLDAVLQMAPRRIVMVSCNPATAARDVRYLVDSGAYHAEVVRPADLFPRTSHVETVVLMTKERQKA